MTDAPTLLHALTALLLSFLSSEPMEPENDYDPKTVKPAAVEHFDKISTLLADEKERFFLAPFVIADRERKEVMILGQLTGMQANEPVEFFVTAQNSGHDYESVMMSFAAPSDIHKALEAIGLKPGNPVYPDGYQFWPRGDRVQASFQWKPDSSDAIIITPVEATALEETKPMKKEPWVFTGSPTLPKPNSPEEEMVYGADFFSPNSIASTFNLRNTVFDLPRQGNKTQTYGDFSRNPELTAPEGSPMVLILKPAEKGTYPIPLDWTVNLAKDPAVAVKGELAPESATLEDLGAAISERENEDHFLTIRFAEELSLDEAIEAARKLQLIEQHVDTAHIGPPPAGHPYYQAFIPDPRFRERANRPSQPVELHLTQGPDGKLNGTVMDLTEIWGDKREPDIVEKRVATPAVSDWVAYLDGKEKHVPVLFIYAPGATSYKDFLSWITPVLERFPIIFVYTDTP